MYKDKRPLNGPGREQEMGRESTKMKPTPPGICGVLDLLRDVEGSTPHNLLDRISLPSTRRLCLPIPAFTKNACTSISSSLPLLSTVPPLRVTQIQPPASSFPNTFITASCTVLLGEYTQLSSTDGFTFGPAGRTFSENRILGCERA